MAVAQEVGKSSHAHAQALKSQLKHKHVHSTDIRRLDEMFIREPYRVLVGGGGSRVYSDGTYGVPKKT